MGTTRRAAIETAQAYVDGGGFERDLAELVAIPSESQVAEGLPHCGRYLETIGARLAGLGFELTTFDNPAGAGPVLFAVRHERDAAPTVLSYGHGDVIRGQEGRWGEGRAPFALSRETNRLYGRGTADNKAQHLINIEAMRATLSTAGGLGANIKLIIETAEENGSAGLGEVIANNRDAFAADVFIASDGPRVAPSRPTVSLGARGAVNFSLVCALRQGAHHSGNWGGALADPAVVLAHAIAAIVDARGRILVPEWRPPLPSEKVRKLLCDVALDAGGEDLTPDDGWGEPGLSAAENVYAFNAFSVLSMISGNPDAPVNAIAPRAEALCQLRTLVETDPNDVVPALRRHLDALGFTEVAVAPPPAANTGGFKASRTDPDHPWVRFVCASLERTAARPPVVIPQTGGSICNELFTDLLGLPAIWIPHSYPGCAQHAPNEHVLLPVCREAIGLMAGLFTDIAEGGHP